MSLPRSALLAVWLNAVLRGSVGPDDFAAAVRGDDPQHLVVDWPTAGSMTLEQLPAAVQRASGTAASLAFPIAGDLLGLRGPSAFNTLALDAGEAVVVVGTRLGLVPGVDARTVVWQAGPADAAPALDRAEEGRLLRQALVTTTTELTRLDVASWEPEIPDLLMNVRHRPELPLPPGTEPRAVEDLERAALCLDIVELALGADGGARSAYEMSERRRCLTELDRAARRVAVAVCSDSLTGS
ncbi:MAG: hypothetical protein JF565_06025 [Propionibacteriales bacterium]|nr:hypothetical protein [Propionibacteriales bacterium]